MNPYRWKAGGSEESLYSSGGRLCKVLTDPADSSSKTRHLDIVDVYRRDSACYIQKVGVGWAHQSFLFNRTEIKDNAATVREMH